MYIYISQFTGCVDEKCGETSVAPTRFIDKECEFKHFV